MDKFQGKYNKLENMILEILKQDKDLKEFQEKRRQLIQKHNYLNDGNASQRIVDLLTK